MDKIRVAIVEDDDDLRRTFSEVVGQFTDCCCINKYSSAEAAMEGLPRDDAKVVLMDINMPGMNGIECVRQLKPALPKTEFLMLTVYEDTNRVLQSLEAGASGYLLKQASWDELLAAIKLIHAGGSPMSSHIARKVALTFRKSPARNETEKLSAREQQILDLLAKGYLYKEIPAATGITYATVHSHIRRIYVKLQVHSRAQATAKYFAQASANR